MKWIYNKIMTEFLEKPVGEYMPNPLLTQFAHSMNIFAKCRRCKTEQPIQSGDATFYLDTKGPAKEGTLQKHIDKLSEIWAWALTERAAGRPGLTKTRATSDIWCEKCEATTPHDWSQWHHKSCPVLVIQIRPALKERTETSPLWWARAPLMELNKMDCAKWFRCGERHYNPVALFIDNRDIHGKHVSYSVLVQYDKRWFKVSGNAVTPVEAVEKDTVIMVWAVLLKKLSWFEHLVLG